MSTPVRGCWTKIRYATVEDARLGVADSEKRFKKPFEVYSCRDEKGLHFHLTSQHAIPGGAVQQPPPEPARKRRNGRRRPRRRGDLWGRLWGPSWGR